MLRLPSRLQTNGRGGAGGCPRLQSVHTRKQRAQRLVLLSRVQTSARGGLGGLPRVQRVLNTNQSASMLRGPGGVPHLQRDQLRKQALSAPSHMTRAL